jgi:RecJ-like exonuclease
MNTQTFDMRGMLSFLPPDQRKSITAQIEKATADRFMSNPCLICQGTVSIPVSMSEEVWCEDCGDSSNRIACLHCIREWLELNKRPEERQHRKHLICNRMINTTTMNARKSYRVEEDIIDLLDKHYPMETDCKCGFKGTRREMRMHTSNATCPKSTWKCPLCDFRGVPSAYVIHTQNCSRIKSLLPYY